jgi:hypothetical protein
MKVTQITDDKTLWAVEDVVDQTLVDKLQEINWWEIPTVPFMSVQDRKIVVLEAVPLLQKIDSQMRAQAHALAKMLDLEFDFYYNDFWLDYPGWTVPMHTDSAVFSSWQMYWAGPSTTGTTFYHDRLASAVRYQAPFKPNTGYVMLNMPKDGVQELNWHDMRVPIPENSIRLTSYTRLGPYRARTNSHH